MDSIASWLRDPIAAIALGALGVLVGVLVSWVLHRQSRARPRLALASRRYIHPFCETCTQAFGRRLRVAIWNAENSPLRLTDFPRTAQPILEIPSFEITEIHLPATKDDRNDFRALLNAPSRVALTFEYLNPQDGAVLLLEGSNVARRGPRTKSIVIGGDSVVEKQGHPMLWWNLPLPAVLITPSLYHSALSAAGKQELWTAIGWAMLVGPIWVFCILSWFRASGSPRSGVCRGRSGITPKCGLCLTARICPVCSNL